MKDAVNSMKRMFPGVRGRLIELCSVTEKRFTLAATIVLGKHIDAIVVDTESVRAARTHARTRQAARAHTYAAAAARRRCTSASSTCASTASGSSTSSRSTRCG